MKCSCTEKLQSCGNRKRNKSRYSALLHSPVPVFLRDVDIISGEHLFTNESNLHPRSKQTYTTVETGKELRLIYVALRCGRNQTLKHSVTALHNIAFSLQRGALKYLRIQILLSITKLGAKLIRNRIFCVPVGCNNIQTKAYITIILPINMGV